MYASILTDWDTDALNRYLKQEIAAPSSEGGRYTSVTWHPENPLQILLTTKSWSTVPFLEVAFVYALISAKVISYWCRWETCAATARLPNDTGTVAVVDGCEPLLFLRVNRICNFYPSFYPSHDFQGAKRPASHGFL